MKNEKWVNIKDYEGIYVISTLGRIKRLEHIILTTTGKERILKEIIVKQHITTLGYSIVNLRKDKKSKTYNVHKLMAVNFMNHKVSGHKLVVDHINSVQTDNSLDNLQLITHRKNLSKDKNTGYTSKYIGVSYNKGGKWRSSIMIGYDLIYLGLYETEKEASHKYNFALKNLNMYKGDKKGFSKYIRNFLL